MEEGMKKVLFAAVAVFVVSGSSALYSQGLEAGGVKFSLYGGGGINYPVVKESLDYYEADPVTSGSYFIGFNGFYNVSDTGSLFAGLEYSNMSYKLDIESTYPGFEEKSTAKLKAKYMDVNLGYRFTNFQGFYFDAGLFVGVPVGEWKFQDGGKASGSEKKNEVGLLVGAGYLIPIAETADLNIGLILKRSFTNGYDDGDLKLKRQLLAVKAGVEMKF